MELIDITVFVWTKIGYPNSPKGWGYSDMAKMLPKLLISGDWTRAEEKLLAWFWSARAVCINGHFKNILCEIG